MNVTQLYIETAFCVIEENQHVICSSGLPLKILACRIWIHCVLIGILNYLVSLKKSIITKLPTFFSNLSKKISHTQLKHQVEVFKRS